MYDTLGAEAMEYIVDQTEMAYILATADKLKNIIGLKDRLPSIKYVLIMDTTVDATDRLNAENAGLVVHTFHEVEAMGAPVEEESALPAAADVATICYTR
jgi:long-chain acyl-CoA synthetase